MGGQITSEWLPSAPILTPKANITATVTTQDFDRPLLLCHALSHASVAQCNSYPTYLF